MNEPHGSADAAARGWRGEILREFTPSIARLTVVDDPDGLLGEAGIVEDLRARGFEVVSLDDRIAFRFFYESRYRSRRNRGDVADVVAVLTTGEAHERAVPYDVWRAGRKLSLSLGALFPKLSWRVVNALDRSDLDALHAAQGQEPPAEPLGESATRRFVLRHVFGIAPETIKQASELLAVLLRLHYRRLRLTWDMERDLVRALQRKAAFRPWPLAQVVPDRDAFFAFLQERWPIFLDRLTAGAGAVRETPPAYAPAFSGPAELPFDHPDVRVYVDNLFLEGALRPVAHPRGGEVAEAWARAGVAIDPRADRRRRLDGLLKSVEASLPGDGARHYDWLDFAPRWAQVNALVFDPDADPAGEDARARYGRIRDRIDERFTAWLRRRFEALHNLPASMPVMIHHVPRALARRLHESADGKVALVVMDGLAFDQWVTVRAVLADQRPGLRFREDSLFAWIPTLTTVSRQACFAGRPPRYFPTSIDSTGREPAAWKRFWGDEGLDAARVVYAKNLREPSDLETVAGARVAPQGARGGAGGRRGGPDHARHEARKRRDAQSGPAVDARGRAGLAARHPVRPRIRGLPDLGPRERRDHRVRRAAGGLGRGPAGTARARLLRPRAARARRAAVPRRAGVARERAARELPRPARPRAPVVRARVGAAGGPRGGHAGGGRRSLRRH